MKNRLQSAMRLFLLPGYGPWATTLDTELGGVGLSIFWKRRMTMLSTAEQDFVSIVLARSALLVGYRPVAAFAYAVGLSRRGRRWRKSLTRRRA